MIQAEALFHLIKEKVTQIGKKTSLVSLPSFCKGFFYGHADVLKENWSAIGINSSNIHWSTTTSYGELFFS